MTRRRELPEDGEGTEEGDEDGKGYHEHAESDLSDETHSLDAR